MPVNTRGVEMLDHLYHYRARYVRAVDGDTVIMLVDLGMKIHSTQSIRVKDVDAPELFRGDNRAAGSDARVFAHEWFSKRADDAVFLGLKRADWEWPFVIHTHRDRASFNRYIADIYCVGTGESFAEALIEGGHGTKVDE